ncbi:MAG: SPOR domain-containing protein, partial [Ketobacter sp.]|nr:SPOR domain-containing protein [Ketobacter sp.]
QQNWRKISSAHDDVLGNMPHKVVRADLGAKGVFYRLRVGGFSSSEAASGACQALQARRQGCFLAGQN